MKEDFLPIPSGFQFAAGTAGIKISGSPDLALVLSPGASAAAMFTSNRVTAAPVQLGRAHLRRTGGKVSAVIINSGNANCATGREGLRVAEKVCKGMSAQLGCKTQEIFPSSTGIIGVPLPADRIVRALPDVVQAAGNSPEHFRAFSRAIMTTDTRPKTAFASVRLKQGEITVLGAAKGAGMIHPRLATMLVYLFTDAKIKPAQLRPVLAEAGRTTFNRISIDGDTSTNDTLLLLASGASQLTLDKSVDRSRFAEALQTVCSSLAQQIVADGEGVQHVVALHVEEAANETEAEQVARAIAHSPLVKTAWAGADPNWGRVLAAVGYSGVPIRPEKVSIFFGPHCVCRNGGKADFDEAKVHDYLKQGVLEVRVRIGRGRSRLTFWTCDLTAEYVRINADYHT